MNAIALSTQRAPSPEPIEAGQASGLARHLVDIATKSLDDGKAEDIVVIDLAGKTTLADHMIIATGRSGRQVAALADNLLRRLREAGQRTPQIEGLAAGDWVLIDAGDLIVHLFRPDIRSFYNLEKMWGDAGPVAAAANPDLRLRAVQGAA